MIVKNKLQAYRKSLFLASGLVVSGLLLIVLMLSLTRSSASIENRTLVRGSLPGLQASPIPASSNVPVDLKGFSNVNYTIPKSYEKVRSGETTSLYNNVNKDGKDRQIEVSVTRNTQGYSLETYASRVGRLYPDQNIQQERITLRDYIGVRQFYFNPSQSKYILHYVLAVPRERLIQTVPNEYHDVVFAYKVTSQEIEQGRDLIQSEMLVESQDFMNGYSIEDSLENE